MTRPFSPAQKFRILVRFDAQIIVDNTLTRVSSYAYGTERDDKRFGILRKRVDCVVRCACGCDVWAPLCDIDFDHVKEFVSGGLTAVSNGQPLRRTPCHAEKSAIGAGVTGWVRKARRKLSVTTGLREDDSPRARTSHRSWPQRSLTHPTLKKTFSGKVERRAP